MKRPKTGIVVSTDPYIRLFPVKKDPDWATTRLALSYLFTARFCRQKWNDTLKAAIATYGDLQPGHGPISGIYADHFPTDIKDQLRNYARTIGVSVDTAAEFWAKAGRRMHTFRSIAQLYRRLNDGTVSYY